MKHVLCAVGDLPPGSARRFMVKDRIPVVALCTLDGKYRAVYGRCAHRAAPLEYGEVMFALSGREVGDYQVDRNRPVLHCPWHGYDYDLRDGACLSDPNRFRIRTYRIVIEGESLVLML